MTFQRDTAGSGRSQDVGWDQRGGSRAPAHRSGLFRNWWACARRGGLVPSYTGQFQIFNFQIFNFQFSIFNLRTIRFLVAIACFFACAAPAFAEGEKWPDASGSFSRGLGYYYNPFKIGLVIVLFWSWIKSTEWATSDCFNIRWNHRIWNPILVGTFFFALVLLFLLPWFALAFLLLLIAWVAPLATYILMRNKRVEEHERVLTRAHIRHLIAQRGKLFGVKVKEKKELPQDAGPPVSLMPSGGPNEGANQAALLLARQSPGFVTVKELIAEAVSQRADGIQLESSAVQVVVQHRIDGFLQSAPTVRERVSGSNALAALFILAGLNGKDRRTPLSGRFSADYKGVKYDCHFQSQPLPSGDKVFVQVLDKTLAFNKLEELGLRAKLEEQLIAAYNQEGGLVVLSALPGNGLTTTIDVLLKTRDRYMREHAAVEEKSRREREIENVQATVYDESKKETPATVLPKLLRTYPNVIVVRDVPDLDTLKILCEQKAAERMAVTSVRAKDCIEAIFKLLMLKIPQKEFAASLTAVVNQRLLRKLCDKCRSPYTPSPELLKQLGLPEGRVSTMYNVTVYKPPLAGQKSKVKPCEQCGGVGFFGRTALFEVLIVDDGVREAIIKTPKPELVKAAARKAGMRTLQEEGILLAARGVTSIQELQRVLKQ